jgi:hypothetical protein
LHIFLLLIIVTVENAKNLNIFDLILVNSDVLINPDAFLTVELSTIAISNFTAYDSSELNVFNQRGQILVENSTFSFSSCVTWGGVGNASVTVL